VRLTGVHLRHNLSHEGVGDLFGASADVSENPFHEGVALLWAGCPLSRGDAEKRGKKSEPRGPPTEPDRRWIDRLETPIRRPSDPDRLRRPYSGKKKRLPLHADLRIYEDKGVDRRFPHAKKIADPADRSAEDPTLPPHKKPKGGARTPEQREANRPWTQPRIYGEPGLRRVKGAPSPGRVPVGGRLVCVGRPCRRGSGATGTDLGVNRIPPRKDPSSS